MAIWKEQTPAPAKTELAPKPLDATPKKEKEKEVDGRIDLPPSFALPRRVPDGETKESVIAAELTIEGKIEGAGHVRIAGRFKGDVHVQGNLTIEAGAKLTGGVRASTVTIGGELEGNIEAANRVELLETGVLNGDLKAGSLTVAAGSRMRGQVGVGWGAKSPPAFGGKMESGSAA